MEGLLLYKLIILFMLDRTDYTMTNSLISGFVVGKGYTSLFNLHEALSELISNDFISTDTVRDTIHYKISNSGEEALSYFENRLPYTIKQDIHITNWEVVQSYECSSTASSVWMEGSGRIHGRQCSQRLHVYFRKPVPAGILH